MKRLSILTIQFYKLLLWYNVAFTILGLLLLRVGGLPINATSFFIAKIIGLVCAIAVYSYYSKHTYFYFRNAGYKARWILTSAIIPDILVYFIIVIAFFNV